MAGIAAFFITVTKFSWYWPCLTALVFLLTDTLGIQIGVHRILCHRALSIALWLRNLLAVLSVLSGQGSPLVWVAVHMGSHHPFSDTPRDIHAPLHGRFHAFLAWYWKTKLRDIPLAPLKDYSSDPVLSFLHRYHAFILLGYWLLLLSIAGFSGLFWLGVAPLWMSLTLAGLVNSVLHGEHPPMRWLFWQYQHHPGESNFNSFWVGVLTGGLGFHNNHHHAPRQLHYRERWYEWDVSELFLPLVKWAQVETLQSPTPTLGPQLAQAGQKVERGIPDRAGQSED